MRYIEIQLKGFKRLALNNIDYIRIKPENKIQLILGTNGSGKSSLMKEITPLPANHQEFHKDGFKIVELIHNNCHYLLKSLFPTGGNKFHFIKDGEEMNPGGTMTTYRELVRKEFGITPDIHELLIGSIRFHAMSTAERRTWLTRLSEADYTYAIQYFKKLSEQHRDIMGGIKTYQARLVQESEKLLKPEQEQVYRDEISMFSQMLSHLLEMKTPIYQTRDQVAAELNQHERMLKDLSAELVGYRKKFLNLEAFNSIEEIDAAIIASRGQAQAEAVLIEQLCQQIQNQQGTLDALKESNVESVSDLDKSIETIALEVSELKKQITLNLDIKDAKEAYNALSTVYENLHSVAMEIEVNDDRRYSRDRYQASMEKQRSLQILLTQTEAKLQQCINQRKELEHFKEHNHIECPNCQHTWYKGYDEKTYQQVLKSITELNNSVTNIKNQIEVETTYLEKVKTYLEYYRIYAAIAKSWPILNPLWELMSAQSLIFDNPRQILNVLETLKIDLQVMIRLEEAQKKFKETVDLKELLSKNQQASVSNLNVHIEKLNSDLFDLNTKQRRQLDLVETLNIYKDAALNIQSIESKIQSILDQRDSKVTDLVNLYKREAISEVIELVRMELQKREHMISRIDIQKALVANIETQIAELIEKAEVLKLAVTELSPSQGLIAKGLTGFINHFVNQINLFIKKIWLYPLELIPIAPDEEDGIDLDYKFEFRVNDDVIISDISKGSTGMKEVIDLAFKIVAMQYLHLTNAPIYLDELAASFDKSHREAAYRMIHDLMINSNYSQIYIISHFADSYGSFNNSDVITLCDANIARAKDSAFNRTVEIR